MNWQCPYCHVSLELSKDTEIAFCPSCGVLVEEVKSNPAESPTDQEEKSICPVCCSPILPEEEKLVCPDCQMAYHKECWNDNNGCATYGCRSAGCLNPPPLKVDVNGADSSGSEKLFCPHCGVSLTAGTAFCWSCGCVVNSGEKSEDIKSLEYYSKYLNAVSWLGWAAFVTVLNWFFLLFHLSWFSFLSPSLLLMIPDDIYGVKIFLGIFFSVISGSLWLIAKKYLWGLVAATILYALDVFWCLLNFNVDLILPLVIHLVLVIIFSKGVFAGMKMKRHAGI